jgi:hypothetical protein
MKGTLTQLGLQMAQSFQKLKPAEQDRVRREIYEKITGKPFRVETREQPKLRVSDDDRSFMRCCGIEVEMSNQQLVLFELAPEPAFTHSEYDEIMGWRVARMKEAGIFPSFEEVNAVVTRVLAKYAPTIRNARTNS